MFVNTLIFSTCPDKESAPQERFKIAIAHLFRVYKKANEAVNYGISVQRGLKV